MQRKRKLLALFLLLAITVVSFLSISAVITLIPANSLLAKNANIVWEKTYGGTGDDRAFFATTAENGYFVVGSSTSFEEDKTVAWVLQLDRNGNAVWNRTFSEGYGGEFRWVLDLSDGFLLVGNIFSSSGGTDGYVIRINSEGTSLWNLTLKAGNGVNKLFSAQKTQDGFLLVGLTKSSSDEDSDVWLVKIDVEGNILWNKTYGESNDDAGRAATLTCDNCYMVAGYTDSMGNGEYNFLVLKIDASGNTLWSKTYGGPQSDKAYAIAPSAGGCVIAGDTRSEGAGDSDAWVIKIDLDGNLLWEKTVGGKGFDVPTCVTFTPDGGYLVGGTTFSFGNGQRDFWLFRIDDTGKVFWSCTVGRSNYEEAYVVLQVAENEFFMAGWTNSVGEGRYDFYAVAFTVEP
jgi:hypothetical protein